MRRYVLLILILLLPVPAQAINLFTETFDGYGDEAATLTALRSKYACSYSQSIAFGDGAAQDLDTAQKFAGTYALKQTYSGSQYDNPPQGGGACQYNFDTVDPGGTNRRDVWITWYHYFAPTWQSAGGGGVGGVATKGLYMYMRSLSTGQVNGWVFHYFYGGRQLTLSAQGIKDARGPASGGYQPVPYDTENMWQNISAYDQPMGRWVCYEANYRLNNPGASDGQYLLYSTDMTSGGQTILRASYTGREFVGATPSDRMPSDARWYAIKYYRQDGSGSMWYDNTYVDSTRRGCTGAPATPGDTTPPAQVAGLAAPSNTTTSTTYTWTANTESDLAGYVIQACQGAACTNFSQVGTVAAPTVTFTASGRTANTLYRTRVAALDAAGNVGTFSSIVDDTTDAASVLPGVTRLVPTSTGGTITYTGTPVDFRIEFGGDFSGSTNIVIALAAAPGGVFSFVWPAGTTWACAYARAAGPTEGPDSNCNAVQASTGGTLTQLGRWFTDGTGKALLLAGMSGTLTQPNATRSALQDFTISQATDGFARADNADLGASWDPGYAEGAAFKIASNGVECSVANSDSCLEAYTGALNNDQAAEVLVRNWSTASDYKITQVLLRMANSPTETFYRFTAELSSGVWSTRIEREVAGVNATITTPNTTAWASGDIMRATANGTTLTLYKNGVPIVTATDANIAGGRAGLFSYTGGSSTSDIVLDEFYAWSLSSADPTVNNYVTAFDSMVTAGLNFVRAWLYPDVSNWGDAAWFTTGEARVPTNMLPWLRTGVSANCTSGTCVMIGRYNLDSWNEAFFTDLRKRVLAARERGLKMGIVLFEGWSSTQVTYHAFSSPFASGNNEQGIACDTNANGRCEELYTLANVNVFPYQRRYVEKVIDTLSDLDNIFWEIINEPNGTGSLAWQDAIADVIDEREALSGRVHLKMQSPYINPAETSNAYLRSNTRFDVIAPSCLATEDYDTNPPVSDGVHIEMYDTDHTGVSDMCGTEISGWPWKTFLRGRHPILLGERESAPVITQLKVEMAQALSYANRVNLAAMTPQGDTTILSTAYGLVNACSEYLMYMPTDGSSTIDLSACGGTYDVEYLNVTSGAVSSGGTTTGGASRSFNPAGTDPMVVYLKLNSITDTTPPVITSCITSPATPVPSGTTSVTVQCTTNEAATLKLDPTAGTAYDSMATTFSSTGGMIHTQTVGSLTDGNSYTRYVRATDGTNPTTTDYPVSWSVLTAAPALPPGNVASLTGTLDEEAGTILWQWPAVSGAAYYRLEISEGGNFVVAIETASPATTSYVQGSLMVGSYSGRIKAVNDANLQSVAWTASIPVIAANPPQITGLVESAPGSYTNLVILTWTPQPNSNLVASWERCTPAPCSNFSFLTSGSAVELRDSTVAANTSYCYRGKYSNPVLGGTSVDWSATLCATTRAASAGALAIQRRPVPFNQPRLPRN